jgi:hypothetical protein
VANSQIYFYPASGTYGGLTTIDFGETVSDLQITPYRVVSDGLSIGGRFSRTARRSGMRVRIVLERFTDFRLAEKFYSLQSHLEAGGGFSFAVDSAKKFAAFIEAAGSSGGISLRHDLFTHAPRVLSVYGAHGLAADDVIHMESFGPGGRREEMQVQTYTEADAKIETRTGAIYEHRLPALVRHRDFFPFLVWPQDQMSSPIITHDRRISWTVDFTCEVYPSHLLAMYNKASEDGDALANDSADSTLSQSSLTLDTFVAAPLYVGDQEDDSSAFLDFDIGGTDPLTSAVEKIEKIT